MNNLYAYLMICIVLVLSPGPNTFLIFSTASSAGKKDALMKIIGLVTATYVHGLLSLFGISLLILQSEQLFFVVKMLGALYLFYIGLKFVWQAWQLKEGQSITSIMVHQSSPLKNFRDGFITQILNPKVSMFYIAAFPQFINFSDSHYHLQGMMLISIHAMTIALWFTFMTFAIGKFAKFTSNYKVSKTIMYFSGVFLIYFSYLLGSQPLAKR